MPVNKESYLKLKAEFDQKGIVLVAVSKTKPVEEILELYSLGHRDFGENYVQELQEKQAKLPSDLRWHFIGHLQSNKVKFITPYVYMIHGVDSLKLLREISKQAGKEQRIISCLFQVHIAKEETKFGFNETELKEVVNILQAEPLPSVNLRGLMGMASLTEDHDIAKAEFGFLKNLFNEYRKYFPSFDTLSMGMSGDYAVAITEGSTMVRIGSLIFGERN